MVLTLTQDPQVQETNVAVAVVLKLYDLATDSNNTVKLVGSITVPAAYDQQVTFLNNYTSNNSDFTVTANTSYVWFEDPEVRSVLLNRVTHSGEGITAAECWAITNMSNWFKNNLNIETFDEFSYFRPTGSTTSMFEASSIKSINFSNLTRVDNAFCAGSTLEGDVSIPNLQGTVGNSAFKNSKITNVNDLGSITELGGASFMGCIYLLSITIPSTCITIGASSFENCSSLGEVIGFDNIKYVYESGFYGVINLANGLKDSLGNAIFSQTYNSGNANQTSLGGANLSNLRVATRSAFHGNGMYGYINLPNAVIPCGFSNNPGITYINAPNAELLENRDCSRGCWNCTGLTGITIKPGLTEMPSLMFQGCSNLTTLDMQGGSLLTVKVFGESCFLGCSLLNITSSDLLGAETIRKNAFNGSGFSSSTLSLPNLKGTLADCAFSNLTSITTVSNLGGITTMGEAFSGCTNLTTITIPTSVTNINGSFDLDTAIEIEILPHGLIRDDGELCRKKTSSTLKYKQYPSTVTYVKLTNCYRDAWNNWIPCNVIIQATTPPSNGYNPSSTSGFGLGWGWGRPYMAKFYVPDSALNSYYQHPDWAILHDTYNIIFPISLLLTDSPDLWNIYQANKDYGVPQQNS